MMSFLKGQRDIDKPGLDDRDYIGVVVDNNDPEGIGRLRVRVPELHGTDLDVPDDHLPWCVMVRPPFMGAGSNLSHFAVPRIGTRVVLRLSDGNIYSPMYYGEPVHVGAEITGQDVNSYVFRDSDGNFFQVNLDADTFTLQFNGDMKIEAIGGELWLKGSDIVFGPNKASAKDVARVGDPVSGGVIVGGSSNVRSD